MVFWKKQNFCMKKQAILSVQIILLLIILIMDMDLTAGWINILWIWWQIPGFITRLRTSFLKQALLTWSSSTARLVNMWIVPWYMMTWGTSNQHWFPGIYIAKGLNHIR